MRNLKKILALVLSLMMVLSVMVTASAADFSDADEIQYTEAVEVMSALGILKGVDGKFVPNGTLTRAQAAKIITFIALGANTDALVKGTGSNQFTDVTGGWAYDYISYCANEGIISGDQGKFFPNADVTGYQFGKMVLNVAGIEGKYTGSGWELRVATALKDSGLLAGLSNLLLSAKITREQASQLAFNAMNYATKVTAGYAVKDSSGTVLGYYNTILEAATAAKVLGTGYTYDPTKTTIDSNSLAVDKYALRKLVTTSGIGFNGYYWYVDKDGSKTFSTAKDTLVSGFITTDTVIGTYTTADSYAAVSADLGVKANYTANVYNNGAASSPATSTITWNSTSKVSSDTSKTLTVVVTADKAVNFLYSEEVLTDVTRGAKVTDKSSDDYGKYAWTFKKTTDSSVTVLTVYADAAAYDTAAKYLVVAKNDTTPLSVKAAKTVTGAITATAATYIRVAGVQYYKANSTVSATANATTIKTVYLNSADCVAYVGTYSAAGTTFDGYAYVSALEYVATPYSSTGLVDEGTDASITAKAKLVTSAGETLTVDVLTQIVKSGATYVSQYYLNGWQNTTANNMVQTVVNSTNGAWYAYNIVDGAYKLTTVGNVTVANAAAKTASITVDGTAHYMTTGTVISFVDYNTDTQKVETVSVTGYTKITADIANNLNGPGKIVVAADSNKVISSITVLGDTRSATVHDFAVYAGEGELDAILGQYHTFVVNGETKSYLLDNPSVVTGLNKGDIVNFVVNSDGKVATAMKVESVSGLTVTKNVTVKSVSADGTYFVNGADTVVTLANGYVVYDVEANGYAVTSLVANDTQQVTTIATSAGVVAIFITTAAA